MCAQRGRVISRSRPPASGWKRIGAATGDRRWVLHKSTSPASARRRLGRVKGRGPPLPAPQHCTNLPQIVCLDAATEERSRFNLLTTHARRGRRRAAAAARRACAIGAESEYERVLGTLVAGIRRRAVLGRPRRGLEATAVRAAAESLRAARGARRSPMGLELGAAPCGRRSSPPRRRVRPFCARGRAAGEAAAALAAAPRRRVRSIRRPPLGRGAWASAHATTAAALRNAAAEIA